MKKSDTERREKALAVAKARTFANSRAKRTGSQTEEEWQAAKDAEIRRLEEILYGRKTS